VCVCVWIDAFLRDLAVVVVQHRAGPLGVGEREAAAGVVATCVCVCVYVYTFAYF
jgi:hypothetical protein